MFFYRLGIILFKPFQWYASLRFVGTENIDQIKDGTLIICNHISWKDPFYMMCSIKRRIYFMAKQELFKNRLFTYVLKQVGVFPVDRRNVGLKPIRTALDVLKSGGICAIFPEGTRSKDKQLHKFEEGVAFIAMRCNAVVVPSYITPNKLKGHQYFIVGQPIHIATLLAPVPKEEQRTFLTKKLYEAVDALRREISCE